VRNGVTHRFDSGGVKVFQPGDRIVVIKANSHHPEELSGPARKRAKGPDLSGTPDRSQLPPGLEPRESARPPVRDLR
jgi:voltage-gated potassium channel